MPPHETYADAARERDLLKTSIELALPHLERVRRYVIHGGDQFEAQMALDKALRDLTVGNE